MNTTLKMEATRSTLSAALRIAAEQFDKDATVDNSRLSATFKRQADEARAMADDIDEAEVIYLKD